MEGERRDLFGVRLVEGVDFGLGGDPLVGGEVVVLLAALHNPSPSSELQKLKPFWKTKEFLEGEGQGEAGRGGMRGRPVGHKKETRVAPTQRGEALWVLHESCCAGWPHGWVPLCKRKI